MKNKLTWLDTEYLTDDNVMQPVLVNGELWYTVFDSRGHNSVFDTFMGVYHYLNGYTSERKACYDNEDDMIKFLEEL